MFRVQCPWSNVDRRNINQSWSSGVCYFNATFLKKKKFFLEDISPFCGTTDTPVLDLWWFVCPGFQSHAESLVLYLCATEPSHLPLVQHLLTSWWLSHFNQCTCTQTLVRAIVWDKTDALPNKTALQYDAYHTLANHRWFGRHHYMTSVLVGGEVPCLPVNRQTSMKTLPSRNFDCGW